MKRFVLIFFVVFYAGFHQSCKKSESLEVEPDYIWLNEKGKKLLESSSGFGIDLFLRVADAETTQKNWMISPLSVSLALAMTYNGANGETKTAFENTLKLSNLTIDEININYKQIADALHSVDENVELSIANSIWYRNSFSVLQNFIDVNEDFYKAKVSPLDFDDANAKNVINSWVSDNTNNRIETIVDEISAQSVMFLINAIYFKGIWKYEFNPSENLNLPFTYDDGTSKQIEMMRQTTNLKRMSNENFAMVELPYGTGNWVMDLILPDENSSVNELFTLFSISDWNTWITELSEPVETMITLPPFKFDYDATLNDILKSLGLGIAFSPNTADFSKINTDGQLFISKVKHKSFIEVNEVGTEAAAATSVDVGVTSEGDNIIVFNRPFLFIIREISTGAILFMGKVGNPER